MSIPWPSVIIIGGPTGGTGKFETVNLGQPDSTDLFETVFQLDGFTGPTGTFRTVIGGTGATGRRTIIVGNALWTPLNDPNLVEWWDASSGVVLSGSNISTWTGRKGRVAAPGANTPPTFSATARNGKPGLLFNGAGEALDFIPTGFPAGASARTLFLGGYSSVAVPTPAAFAFSYGTNTTAAGTSNYLVQQESADPTPGASAGGSGNSGSNCFGTHNWGLADVFLALTLVGQSANLYNNGGATPDMATLGPTTNTGLIGGGIGYWPAYGNSWAGSIQQIVVVSGVSSAGDLAKYAGWASWYTGQAGANLPAGSPYKTAPPYASYAADITLLGSDGNYLLGADGAPLLRAA